MTTKDMNYETVCKNYVLEGMLPEAFADYNCTPYKIGVHEYVEHEGGPDISKIGEVRMRYDGDGFARFEYIGYRLNIKRWHLPGTLHFDELPGKHETETEGLLQWLGKAINGACV